jgi:hypothetical protein
MPLHEKYEAGIEPFFLLKTIQNGNTVLYSFSTMQKLQDYLLVLELIAKNKNIKLYYSIQRPED